MIDINDEELREKLSWLIDVPMFIDEQRIGQLYDITVEPVFEEYRRDLTAQSEANRTADSVKNTAKVEGGAGIPGLSGFSLKGVLGRESSETDEETDQRTYTITQGSQRQLAQIAIQYLQTGSETESDESEGTRVNSGGEFKKFDSFSEFDGYDIERRNPSGQRDLVVLQVPGLSEIHEDESSAIDTTLVPTAAEFEDGSTVQLYEKLGSGPEGPPRYPERDLTWRKAGSIYDEVFESEYGDSSDESLNDKIGDKILSARERYWNWFRENFNAKEAIIAIENAAGDHGNIRWIDFRLPYSETGKTLHLHVQGREEYNTGTFAYNLVKRGQKHGLTIVGTIKSEPDMDVLAIYER